MDVKIADQTVQDTVSVGFGGILLAALLWLGRLIVRLVGIPRRVLHLEQTSAAIITSQRAQTRALLLLVPEDNPEAERVKAELHQTDGEISELITKLATGGKS